MAHVNGGENLLIALKGDSAFIRYSANADGTDFIETWNEEQKYIGFATGQTAPTDKSDYTWVYMHNAKPNADFTVLYALKSNGENVTQRLTPHAVNNTVMFRDINGYCKIKNPTKDEHIANKGYVDAEIKTLKAKIETLKALVDKLDKQLNPMLDVWRISDTAQIYDCSIRDGFTFYANGAKFDGIYIGEEGDPHLVYLRNGEWVVYVDGMSWAGEDTSAYRTIGFDPNQDISQEFLDWLEANATFIGNEPIPEEMDMIFFSVHGVSFSCPGGMTWNEFIGSEYDTTVDRDIDIPNSMFAIDNWGEGDVVQYDWSSVYYEHGGYVYATDKITDGTAY